MAFRDKTVFMQIFLNRVAEQLYGISVSEALAQHICVKCKKVARSKCYLDAGVAEYQTSGLCEACFDEITGGPTEHKDFS